MQRLVERLQRFFASWRFPALTLGVLLSFKLLLITALVFPAPRGLEAFADEFKIWCFGYDPRAHTYEYGYVAMTLAEPLVIGAIIAFIWWRPLRQVFRDRPRALVPYGGVAALIVAVACAALFAMRGEARADALSFPRASLRTALEPPKIDLVDQEGERFSLEAQRGRVVVVTGVYASCGFTCPMIMGQAKRAISALSPEERRGVTVAAITLDPEHDDQARLRGMSAGQMALAPTFRFLWGPPAEVNATLDDLAIARTRDPATGRIDHVNMFVLIDRRGKIAYRLSIDSKPGGTQESWLADALRALLSEPGPA